MSFDANKVQQVALPNLYSSKAQSKADSATVVTLWRGQHIMMAKTGLLLEQIRKGQVLTVCITIQHDSTPNGLTAAHGTGNGLLSPHLANEGDIHGRHSAALWANQLAYVAMDLNSAPCNRETEQCISLCKALGGSPKVCSSGKHGCFPAAAGRAHGMQSNLTLSSCVNS